MMNLCKSAGGGISARTKSLRERFSSKRSYSELSFKDSSASSTPTGETPPPALQPTRSFYGRHSSTRAPKLPQQV